MWARAHLSVNRHRARRISAQTNFFLSSQISSSPISCLLRSLQCNCLVIGVSSCRKISLHCAFLTSFFLHFPQEGACFTNSSSLLHSTILPFQLFLLQLLLPKRSLHNYYELYTSRRRAGHRLPTPKTQDSTTISWPRTELQHAFNIRENNLLKTF